MKAKIWNYNKWVPGIIRDEDVWAALKTAGFTVCGFMDYDFKPQGRSAVWLLAESHFAYHTFPEENKTYVELSSCNREMYRAFKALI